MSKALRITMTLFQQQKRNLTQICSHIYIGWCLKHFVFGWVFVWTRVIHDLIEGEMVSKLSQCVVRMRAGAPMGRFPVSLSAGSLFHPHRVMDDPDQNSSHFTHSRPHWRKCINYLSSLHSHSKK